MAGEQDKYTDGELHHILSNKVRDLLSTIDKMQIVGEYNECVSLKQQREKIKEWLR